MGRWRGEGRACGGRWGKDSADSRRAICYRVIKSKEIGQGDRETLITMGIRQGGRLNFLLKVGYFLKIMKPSPGQRRLPVGVSAVGEGHLGKRRGEGGNEDRDAFEKRDINNGHSFLQQFMHAFPYPTSLPTPSPLPVPSSTPAHPPPFPPALAPPALRNVSLAGDLNIMINNPKVSVAGVVFQNNQGERYHAKYYPQHCSLRNRSADLSSREGQRKFERGLLDKVARMNIISKLKPQDNEIFSFGDYTVLIKVINELLVFLICDEEENYFLMEAVINCIGKVLQTVTKEQWSGKAVYDNLDSVILVTDELIDEGLIANLDPATVLDRMKMRDATGEGRKEGKPVPAQQSVGGAFSSIFGFAKSSLQKTLNLG